MLRCSLLHGRYFSRPASKDYDATQRNEKMVEATDLELVTYVITFEKDGTTYYECIDKSECWYGIIGNIKYTSKLAMAKIYNDPAEAMRQSKDNQQFITTSVKPVAKKIFFEATLRGKR